MAHPQLAAVVCICLAVSTCFLSRNVLLIGYVALTGLFLSRKPPCLAHHHSGIDNETQSIEPTSILTRLPLQSSVTDFYSGARPETRQQVGQTSI